jgi:hypothetical protein
MRSTGSQRAESDGNANGDNDVKRFNHAPLELGTHRRGDSGRVRTSCLLSCGQPTCRCQGCEIRRRLSLMPRNHCRTDDGETDGDRQQHRHHGDGHQGG